MKIRAVRGMNDILPEEARRWQGVEAIFRSVCEQYGYGEVRTPLIEDTALFEKQIGETSDVVEKEMYSFDRHDNRLTVRPEGTAGAARAYVEHSMATKEGITRWYYLGPMFRGERPAKGRYRQFSQAGCELYGDPSPIADAEMIELCVRILKRLQIGGLAVHVNSLGSGTDTRARYASMLRDYFEPFRARLSEDSQRRLEKNPLRILDSKDGGDIEIGERAPTIEGAISDEDKAHFDSVLSALEMLGVPVVVDRRLVRGLDYYTRTLFEIKATQADLGAQSTVCGGGRYDAMIESLGGPATPAIGFAMGLERLLLASKAELAGPPPPFAIVATVGEEAPQVALHLAASLRDRGVRCDVDLRGSKIKNLLRRAESSGARWVLLLGPEEIATGQVSVKDLSEHQQDKVAVESAAELLADRLRGVRT